MYGKGKQPVPKSKEIGSKMKTLSSSVMSIEKNKSKTAARCKRREKDGVRVAEIKEVGVEVDEEEIAAVSKEIKMKNIKEVEKENAKEMGIENSEEVEGDVKN